MPTAPIAALPAKEFSSITSFARTPTLSPTVTTAPLPMWAVVPDFVAASRAAFESPLSALFASPICFDASCIARPCCDCPSAGPVPVPVPNSN